MDMSLDDIISKEKISFPGRGGRGRGRGGSRRGGGPMRPRGGNSNRSYGGMQNGGSSALGKWMHDKFPGAARSRPQPLMNTAPAGPVKLTVSNLDYKVSDSDIRELFGEFGNMTSASIHYDSSGCSLGSAQIMYTNRASAIRAKQQYNGVHLDGRPMNIAMEGDNAMARPQTARPLMSTRVGGGMPRRPGTNYMRGGPVTPRRGGRGRGGAGGRSRSDAKPKSAEELDKELDTYLADAKKK